MSFVVKKSDLLIYMCVFSMILRDFIRVLLGHYEYSSSGVVFVRHTGYIMTALLLLSVFSLFLFCLTSYRENRLPTRLKLSIFFLGIISAFWTVHSLFSVEGYSIFTFDGTAKTILICSLGIIIGYDDYYWNVIKKMIPVMTWLYIPLSAVYVIYARFSSISGRMINEQPYWMLYSTAIWLLAYYLLCYESENKSSMRSKITLMLINLVIVAFTISRGWLIQTAFLYFVFLIPNKNLSRSRKIVLTVMLASLAGIGLYAIKDEFFAALADYMFKFTTSSSRTSQFDTFFSQVSLQDLIFGLGEYASYSYKGNSNYIYIDNSFIYYAFHFGAFFALIMFFLPIREGLVALKKRRVHTDGNIGYILLMWIAALCGASVFCAGYEISFRLLFIMILIGRCAWLSLLDFSEGGNGD